MEAIYQFELIVPESVVDENRHVNNVAYVQWMQDAAIRHSEFAGCTRMTREAGASWFARSHHIEYLSPAFAGEVIIVRTGVANLRKVRSLRRYKFLRAAGGVVLAQGETDWVFVDAVSGRPRAIPEAIQQVFTMLPEGAP